MVALPLRTGPGINYNLAIRIQPRARQLIWTSSGGYHVTGDADAAPYFGPAVFLCELFSQPRIFDICGDLFLGTCYIDVFINDFFTIAARESRIPGQVSRLDHIRATNLQGVEL